VVDGFIVVDKPSGITSHDVVAILRRTLRQKKIGHTGTLDPFATGVLPLAIGEGTKAIPYLDESVKEYQAVMVVGSSTDTLDLTGTVVAEQDWSHVTHELVTRVFDCFNGDILQMPPMFSAVKRDGVPLYKLARKGQTVERAERPVTIHSLEIDRISLPEIAFTVRCTRGTYVRTLADDIGVLLGTGAHLASLRRTASGAFLLENAVRLEEVVPSPLDQLLREKLVSVRQALVHFPEYHLTAAGCRRVRNGIAPVPSDLQDLLTGGIPAPGRIKLLLDDELVAVCELTHDAQVSDALKMKLVRVFNLLSPLQAAF
jgi:tRNA pseudouridine55 synthase